MLLISVTGLAPVTVIIPLTFYAMAVLIPAVVDGLGSVPDHVRQSAVAMGFTPLRRLVQVELPIAVPVVLAGLRVAAVSSISLVSVGALIGQGGLGMLFTGGLPEPVPAAGHRRDRADRRCWRWSSTGCWSCASDCSPRGRGRGGRREPG